MLSERTNYVADHVRTLDLVASRRRWTKLSWDVR